MINASGLTDLACRYQREAYRAAAEAMDLRIALGRMGCRPTEDQVLMSRRFDEAAKGAAERAQAALQFLLFQQTAWPSVPERRFLEAQRASYRRIMKDEAERVTAVAASVPTETLMQTRALIEKAIAGQQSVLDLKAAIAEQTELFAAAQDRREPR